MTAGLLLTGGASHRFGRDKAGVVFDGDTLGTRGGRVLSAVCAPAIEVGDGVSGLPSVREEATGMGPLVAVAAGWSELRRGGYSGDTIVLAVDLPLVTTAFLRWLARYPSDASVIPIVAGRAQSLCARYRADVLDTAGQLIGGGARAMRDLLAVGPVVEVAPADWAAVAPADVTVDIDTPGDLHRLLTRFVIPDPSGSAPLG